MPSTRRQPHLPNNPSPHERKSERHVPPANHPLQFPTGGLEESASQSSDYCTTYRVPDPASHTTGQTRRGFNGGCYVLCRTSINTSGFNQVDCRQHYRLSGKYQHRPVVQFDLDLINHARFEREEMPTSTHDGLEEAVWRCRRNEPGGFAGGRRQDRHSPLGHQSQFLVRRRSLPSHRSKGRQRAVVVGGVGVGGAHLHQIRFCRPRLYRLLRQRPEKEHSSGAFRSLLPAGPICPHRRSSASRFRLGHREHLGPLHQ